MTGSQHDLAFTRLARQLAPAGKLVRAWPLEGGISAAMTALEIEQPGRQATRVIVRRPGEATLARNPRAAHDEYQRLSALRRLGLPTPAPFYLDESGSIFPTPYLVLEYIEGAPEFAPADLADFTHQLAAQLARIHGAECSALGGAFVPKPADDYAASFSQRHASLGAPLDEARSRELLATAWPLPARNPPALLHGDYWPGNILWRGARLAAVIDWEDAALGDPLSDLAVSRLDILWIYGREAFDSFTQHYQSLMPLDYTDLPYWDLYAALRLARLAGPDLPGWAAFFGPFGRPDITVHSIREHYRWFVAQALGQLP